jgi:hypothetical protein
VPSHRRRNTLLSTLAAALVLLASAFFTGAFSHLGEKAADRAVQYGGPSTADNRLPVAVAVDTNQAETNPMALGWTAPQTVPKPTFGRTGDCSTLNSWGAGEPRAYMSNPVYRITLTGDAAVSVVVHRVWPKVVKKEPMPFGWMTLSCPGAGPLSHVGANLNLENPDATYYFSGDGQSLSRLAYSLTRGEAGVFYVYVFNGSGSGRITWDVMLDVTVGSKSQTVNVNETALKGQHFVTTADCGTRSFSWGHSGWVDEGLRAPCKT